MERIPEPELMDDAAQVAAYDGDDLESAVWLFLSCFRKYFPDLPSTGAILDLGCGPGRIALGLARHYPGWEVDGVDGSPPMLDHGRRKILKAGLTKRVRLYQGLLPDRLSLPRTRYEAVVSNSFLHHLADPLALWRTILEKGQRGGAVLVVDLIRPSSGEDAGRLVRKCFPLATEMLRRDFRASLHAAYRVEEVETQLRESGLDGVLQMTRPTPFQFAAYGIL